MRFAFSQDGPSIPNANALADAFAAAVDSEQHMNAMTSSPANDDGYTREVYSVQGAHVTLEPDRGWQCTCKAYGQSGQCIHLEQAHVFKQMRSTKREDDTIELELTAEELWALNAAAAEGHDDARLNEAVAMSKRVSRHSRWPAVLAAAGIAGLSSGITYLVTARTQPVHVAENRLPQPLAAPTPHAAPAPPAVRFVNPFDATEVFELPPGISEKDARDAVAEFLLNRARARLAGSADPHRASGKVVHREKAEHATRLANRS
jgi:hypothetical protein